MTTCTKCSAPIVGGHVCGVLDNSPGLDVKPRKLAAVRAERIEKALRELEDEAHSICCRFDNLDKLNDLCTAARAALAAAL